MITVRNRPLSPAAPLAADLFRIAETADRFERPRAIEIAVERFARADAATRARDARLGRRLEIVATPLVAVGLGVLAAFAF